MASMKKPSVSFTASALTGTAVAATPGGVRGHRSRTPRQFVPARQPWVPKGRQAVGTQLSKPPSAEARRRFAFQESGEASGRLPSINAAAISS
jgi:hypothetical protein